MSKIFKKLQAWLPAWSGIWTGFIGLIIASIAVLSVPLFFIINLSGLASQYLEIVFILLSIIFFIAGIILCLIAYFKMKRAYPVEISIPSVNLKESAIRLKFVLIAIVGGLGFIFIVMSSSSFLEYTESNKFCTNACHDTMQPMAVTHQSSSHSRVDCVDCHIQASTASFFLSKVSGLRRSFAVTFNTHQKPIHLVRHLYPSRASCEHCHWTSKLSGDKLLTKITYNDSSEDNQAIYTAMLLRVGGKSGIDQTSRGIHWHTSENLKIRYKTTKDESEVVWIEELNLKTGKTDTFVTEEYFKTYVNEDLVVKEMSCVDCHNRIAHIVSSPDKALDEAITRGLIDRSLPWIKKQGLGFLSNEHSVTNGLQKEAEFYLMDFYKNQYPEKVHDMTSSIFQAAKVISGIYASNVFPKMKVTWDTHASNVGHMATPGCFRCHNDMLVAMGSSTKKSIRSDCTLCHVFIAQDETNPEKIIKYIESGVNQ